MADEGSSGHSAPDFTDKDREAIATGTAKSVSLEFPAETARCVSAGIEPGRLEQASRLLDAGNINSVDFDTHSELCSSVIECAGPDLVGEVLFGQLNDRNGFAP